MSLSSVGTNWSGNVVYGARVLHRPRTVSELQTLVSANDRVRALGSRHSFTAIADSAELISLAELEGEITIDASAGTVTVPAGVIYAELAVALNGHGLALANLASLPHISVAGAIATGTHGSGDRAGSLATSVVGLELVTADGALLHCARGEPEFPGLVVGLGALGIVTRLTLAVEPAYTVAQRVYEGLDWDVLRANLDAITAAGDSVSVFHRAGAATEQVWVKRRRPAIGSRTSFSGRAPPARRAIRFSAPTRPTPPSSWRSPDRGLSACRTSAAVSRRAPGRRSSQSSWSAALTPPTRSRRCAACRIRSGR